MENKNDPIFQGLNPKQHEAVNRTEGPLIVVAGAGSGKTRVLTHRIAHLIKNKGVRPQNILAVTFTNKAADEMRQRLNKLLGVNTTSRFSPHLPVVGTFHSIGVQILRKEIHHLGYEKSFLIYDDTDQVSLVKKIMADLGLDKKKKRSNPKSFAGAICQAKSNLLTAEDYASKAMTMHQKEVAEVYLRYEKILRKRSAVDFDDLIFLPVRIFERNEEVLDYYQERFLHISIDEYQDTNTAQYRLSRLLSEKYRNICVIGDTDQSIYSWRGANYANLLNFKKDYRDAEVILLEQNYRSTKHILTVGNAVIKQNEKREEKNLWTENEEGDLIEIETFESEQEEARQVIESVREIVRTEGYDYKDCAVLYRLGAQSRALEEACLHTGTAYHLVGGVKFYSRKEVKDVLAYCKLARYPQDDEAFYRVINTPSRKIGPTSIAHLEAFARQEGTTMLEAASQADEIEKLTSSAQKALMDFAKKIADLTTTAHNMPASGVINFICEEIGYRSFLLDGTEEGETRWENVQELLGVSKKYDELEAGISLSTFLEEVSLFTSLDEVDFQEDKLNLMTLHSAKGLEFPVVFIVGMEEGILPHSRSLFDPEQMEEERRLFYVGVTRAKKKLVLTRAKRRLFYGGQNNPPSRFLLELPKDSVSSEELPTEEEMLSVERLRQWGGRHF